MNNQFIKTNPISSAFIAAAVALPLVFVAYFSFEPMVVVGQSDSDSREFTITQAVSEEVSFIVPPNNVEMDQTLSGLTGGTSNGSTTFSIATNDAAGYSVEISFATAGDRKVLLFDDDNSIGFESVSGFVNDLTEPDEGEAGLFGYSVVGNHVDSSFGDDGSVCDSSTTGTSDACFHMQGTPSTGVTIINNPNATDPAGDENSIVFRAVIGPDPDPTLPSGNYTATATLTAFTNS